MQHYHKNVVKRKSTSSDMLNMTFERLQEDEEVFELGSITLLDNGVFSPQKMLQTSFRRVAQLQEFQIMHLEARRVWMVGKLAWICCVQTRTRIFSQKLYNHTVY